MSGARKAVAAWDRFWFDPTATSTLALVRIAFGVVVLAWAISLAGDMYPFFGPGGVQPTEWRRPGAWTVFDLVHGDVAVALLYAALVAGALTLTVGFHTRLAALVVFVCLVSLERESPFVVNAGDQLLRVLAFYLVLAPAGAALSLDRWRRGEPLWEFPERAPWALRLIQLQLSFVYVAAVWAKVRGTTWNDGTALSYALRLGDLERFPVPSFLADVPTFSALLTYGTLAVELSLGILVWNRRLRPWVLLAGVALHLGIDWSLRVGFFTYAVFVMYVAFVPPERASQLIRGARDSVAGRAHGVRRPSGRPAASEPVATSPVDRVDT